LLERRRKSARQAGGSIRSRLHEERVVTLAVLALAADGIDLEPGVARPRALQETVLEAGRALDDQQTAFRSRGVDEHAARVVLADRLGLVDGNLRGVYRRARR